MTKEEYIELHKEPDICKVCGKEVYHSKWFKIFGKTVCDDCLNEEFRREDWEE